MNRQALSSNLNSSRTQFALRFIHALARIKTASTSTSTSSTTPTLSSLQQRSRMIKLAADASMASVVGTRRLWSRAMLLKIKNRARFHALKTTCLRKNKNKNKKNQERNKIIKKIRKVGRRNDHIEYSSSDRELGRTAELRRLVPGGQAMELCSLLKETAHYIKCLNTQVQVMQSIADIYESRGDIH